MPYANTAGPKLYYERAGSGEPELLLVHGWCCDRTAFQPQFDHFSEAHAVTAIDLRGCGRSDVPDEGYSIPDLADDLAQFCGAVGIERPVVVGHSLGGMIAVELGARYPSLPAALVLVDPEQHVAAAVIRGVGEWNGREPLARCNLPVLLLRDEIDESTDVFRLREIKPDLEVGITVGAGHFHQIEVPEQVDAMIERFLALSL